MFAYSWVHCNEMKGRLVFQIIQKDKVFGTFRFIFRLKTRERFPQCVLIVILSCVDSVLTWYTHTPPVNSAARHVNSSPYEQTLWMTLETRKWGKTLGEKIDPALRCQYSGKHVDAQLIPTCWKVDQINQRYGVFIPNQHIPLICLLIGGDCARWSFITLMIGREIEDEQVCDCTLHTLAHPPCDNF